LTFIIRYKRGDFVLVYYPFSDLSQQKKRPALVVSRNDDNDRLENIILVPLTSYKGYTIEPTHILLHKDSDDGRFAGIQTDSIIKCEGIVSLSKRFVDKVIGKSTEKIMENVDICLKITLGIK
jgi:mRNA interferase MazF